MGIALRWPSGLEWLAVIPMLSILVFVHELGHFLAAILLKVRVEEFGFGYPPRMLVLFERKGVKYTLNWLPFGGFVRLAGEESGFDDPNSIVSRKPWQRFIVFFAGSFMNFVLAIVIYVALYLAGVPEAVGPVMVESVSPNSPAAAAGIEAGDVITSIGGQEVRSLSEVQDATAEYLGQETIVVVERNGETFSFTLVPRLPEEVPEGEGAMGVSIYLADIESIALRDIGVLASIEMGVRRAFFLAGAMLEGLGQMVLSPFLSSVPAPEGGVSGPIGIARLTGEVVRGGWLPFLDLAGFFSLNFALLNLLPLPALDGGRLAFIFLEWVRGGKRVPPEREAVVHLVGMLLLVSLMIVVSYFDIVRWIQGESIFPGG